MATQRRRYSESTPSIFVEALQELVDNTLGFSDEVGLVTSELNCPCFSYVLLQQWRVITIPFRMKPLACDSTGSELLPSIVCAVHKQFSFCYAFLLVCCKHHALFLVISRCLKSVLARHWFLLTNPKNTETSTLVRECRYCICVRFRR